MTSAARDRTDASGTTTFALARDAVACFTDRATGNLSHRRPHLPSRLARSRERAAAAVDSQARDLHFMRQRHGARVGYVDPEVPSGAEVPDVDALVTRESGRALVVQVADCVPVLLAVEGRAVAAVHAGRRGLADGVLEAALDALHGPDGDAPVHAAVGPAIGGCCYEVPADTRAEVAAIYADAADETTWGTPALNLPAAVTSVLEKAGASIVLSWPGCTRCDPDARWFSHRRDPASGRQAGIVVRRAPDTRDEPGLGVVS